MHVYEFLDVFFINLGFCISIYMLSEIRTWNLESAWIFFQDKFY
jgi:hypothetical protein